MARIALTSGFTVIPEGHYTFQVTSVEYKEDFGKLEIHLETENGEKHIERYGLYKKVGNHFEQNTGALNAFSFMARVLMNDTDSSMDDVDPQDLVGHFLEADVEWDVVPSTKDPNKTYTNVKLNNKKHSDGWLTEEEAAAEAEEVAEEAEEAEEAPFDLSNLGALLNN